MSWRKVSFTGWGNIERLGLAYHKEILLVQVSNLITSCSLLHPRLLVQSLRRRIFPSFCHLLRLYHRRTKKPRRFWCVIDARSKDHWRLPPGYPTASASISACRCHLFSLDRRSVPSWCRYPSAETINCKQPIRRQ
jgi:hypothetical protein